MRSVCFIALLALVGCGGGARAQQRYLTAQQVLADEEQKLHGAAWASKLAHSRSLESLCKQETGFPTDDAFGDRSEEIREKVSKFRDSALKPGTKEYAALQEAHESTPAFNAFRKQKARVDRAKKELAAAEADL